MTMKEIKSEYTMNRTAIENLQLGLQPVEMVLPDRYFQDTEKVVLMLTARNVELRKQIDAKVKYNMNKQIRNECSRERA
mgnify:CR=1 FL=1